MHRQSILRLLPLVLVMSGLMIRGAGAAPAPPPPRPQASVVHKLQATSERLEMTVHTSRRLQLGQRIPEAQVNNPDVLELTPLAPNEVQVYAKAAGVTQINLWGEDKQIYTVDVIVYPDAQELTTRLQALFPKASLRVIPVGSGVVISGYVDQPEQVHLIISIAEEYYPKVINAITVSGVQQVLLHVKVMEVSRTKLRRLGFDWAQFSNGNFVVSGISGLIASYGAGSVATTGRETFAFNITNGSSLFFGVLDALRQDNLLKILAEPTLVAVSGRPASFNVGGEFPILVPQSLGTVSIEYKKFGTQVEFVPIVLGNGRIRLEVRPRVSEIDNARSVTYMGTTVPGLRSREVDTGVEMQAGQTLALAGLVQNRVESENRGLPWVSELPYLGALFRKVEEQSNEIELLILVTPELVDAMDAPEVPPCGPGMQTTSPGDWELYLQGHLEVPNCCPPCGAPGCDAAAPGGVGPQPMMPSDGMIIEPREPVPTPRPAESTSRRARPGSLVAGAPASQNRYPPSNPQFSTAVSRPDGQNVAPGLIGPVGYDVVK